jgi:hypothetical protein
LIVLIILGERYKFWSSSLCSYLQHSISSSLLGPNVLLSTMLLRATLFQYFSRGPHPLCAEVIIPYIVFYIYIYIYICTHNNSIYS